jgi:hypothetical protein
VRRLDEQVDMVWHQAIGETPPPLTTRHATEHQEIDPAIKVIHKDVAAIIAAGEDMLDGILELLTRPPWHTRSSERRPRLAPPQKGSDPLSANDSRGQTP